MDTNRFEILYLYVIKDPSLLIGAGGARARGMTCGVIEYLVADKGHAPIELATIAFRKGRITWLASGQLRNFNNSFNKLEITSTLFQPNATSM